MAIPEKHVLPEEIRLILRKIAIEESSGPEVEGGLIFEAEVEKALRLGGISSEQFGEQYPNISNSLKKLVAIVFLYEIVKSELNLKIEMPRYKRDPNGHLQAISITEHLETLGRIFTLENKDT